HLLPLYNPLMAKSSAKPTGTLPPVVILAGEELFLRNQHLADIQQSVFQGEDPGMGLVRLDPTALGGGAMAVVLDEARTASMFNQKNLVIVAPADPLHKKADADDDGKLTNREILENYVESAMESAGESTLVLVFNSWLKPPRLHKALDKVGGVRWCEPIK